MAVTNDPLSSSFFIVRSSNALKHGRGNRIIEFPFELGAYPPATGVKNTCKMSDFSIFAMIRGRMNA